MKMMRESMQYESIGLAEINQLNQICNYCENEHLVKIKKIKVRKRKILLGIGIFFLIIAFVLCICCSYIFLRQILSSNNYIVILSSAGIFFISFLGIMLIMPFGLYKGKLAKLHNESSWMIYEIFNKNTYRHWNPDYQEDNWVKPKLSVIYRILLNTGIQNKDEHLEQLEEINQKYNALLQGEKNVHVRNKGWNDKRRYKPISINDWDNMTKITSEILEHYSKKSK